jgi:hypothetical protein
MSECYHRHKCRYVPENIILDTGINSWDNSAFSYLYFCSCGDVETSFKISNVLYCPFCGASLVREFNEWSESEDE